MILGSFGWGLNENVKSISIKYVPKNIFMIGYSLLATIMSILIYSFTDAEHVNIKTVMNLSSQQILSIVFGAIVAFIIQSSVFYSYSLNNTLQNPYNVGILGGIFALQFIFSALIDMGIKTYYKEKISLTLLEGMGFVAIIIGVILSVLGKNQRK